MKKFFCSFLTVFLLMFLFNPIKSFAGVEGASLDQSYEQEGSAYGFLIDNNSKMIQTFKPTRPIIVSIDVDLKNRKAGSTITLTLVDEMDNTVSGHYSHTLTGPDGMNAWETFSFTSPYVGVTTGTTYGIKISVDDAQTRWWYNNVAGYANGYFKATSSLNYDALFRVYSKDNSPAPTASSETTATTAATSSEENNNSSNNNSAADNPTQNIDTSISQPVLKTLSVNNKLVDLNATDTIALNPTDEMVLVGTADKETTVVVLIGTKTFSAKVDKDGNWKIKIKYSELDNGAFDVLAQTQKGDKLSSKANFFKVATNKMATTSQKTQAASFWKDTTNLAIIIGALALIALVLVLYFHRKKLEKEKKN